MLLEKTNTDKGKVVGSYVTDNYDPEKDVCILITKTAYNSNVTYWPQIFVDASYQNTNSMTGKNTPSLNCSGH